MLASLVRFSVRHPGDRPRARRRAGRLRRVAPPRAHRSTSFPSSPHRRSRSRPRPPASRRSRSRCSSPSRSRTSSTAWPGIAIVRSQSIQGLSIITAVLAPGTDIYRARQALAERLVEARAAPARAPCRRRSSARSRRRRARCSSSASRRRPARCMEQRTIVDWMVRPAAARDAGRGQGRVVRRGSAPAPGAGRSRAAPRLRRRHRRGRRGRRAVHRRPRRRRDRRAQPAHRGPVRGPVAHARSARAGRGARARRRRCSASTMWRTVEGAGAPKFGDGAINGEPGHRDGRLGAARRQHQGRGRRRRGSARSPWRPALEREGITLHADVFRPATFIDLALRNITTSLLLGALLVSVVLLLFLADLRTAAISLTAIPLSLLVGDHPARGARLLHQHADARRARHRARRGGGRRHHRRREHRPATAGTAGAPWRGTSARWWCGHRSRCAAAWSTRRSSWRWSSCRCSHSPACRARCSVRWRWPTSSRRLPRSWWRSR